MTIGITGPERKVPRQYAVVGFIIAAVVIGICLILLWLASDFLVVLDRLSAGFLDNNRR
jgi:hypothetical protein